MTRQDRITAFIRTLVPALYGVGITWLIGRFPAVQDGLAWLTATLGVDASAAISLALTAGVIAGFYWVARKLGARFPSLEKWLLGKSAVPIYRPAPRIYTQADVDKHLK